MRLGYNTNGFAGHRLEDACAIIAEVGYECAAITLVWDLLDPPDSRGVASAVARIKPIIDRTGLSVTLETGSRFILDPRRKHQPTLISRSEEGRFARLDYLRAAVEIAAEVGAESVSLWSGTADDDAPENELFARLSEGVRRLLEIAEEKRVRLSFEPEPGMFIDTMIKYTQLHQWIEHPRLGLTLDVGHIHCLEDGSSVEPIRQWREVLWNIHIEDMRRGVHEHLMFGEGDMDFGQVFHGLREINYNGPIHVELPRHSHNAVEIARRSIEFLKRFA